MLTIERIVCGVGVAAVAYFSVPAILASGSVLAAVGLGPLAVMVWAFLVSLAD